MSDTRRVLIIGAGLAGLACARRLTEAGLACTVLEAADEIGGRARTDRVEGFQLDRGFQVFLTGYPEARRTLHYPSLHLHPFHPGALVRFAGRFHRMSDPFRRPQDFLETLLGPIGSFADKVRVLRLRRDALRHCLCAKAGGVACATRDVLRAYGFSQAMLERFFRPFLGGVFLDDTLSTPCWIFESVWAAFSRSAISLPRDGMGAIARHMAAALPKDAIQLGKVVRDIEETNLVLESGERVAGNAVVIATDYKTAAALRGEDQPSAPAREAISLYFDAPAPPVRGPWLLLNGEETGPIRTLCVLSEVASSYAPPGRSLISVSLSDRQVIQEEKNTRAVRTALRGWFGSVVDEWRLLRTYRIRAALPPGAVLSSSFHDTSPRVKVGLYLCGDYRESGTLDGALLSGRKAAEALLVDRQLL
jgi:phytoene dehydrogenase-like protein